MARVRKFDEPGAKEDRIRWNKSGTRKWLTVYTVMEYHPKEASEAKPKKTKPKQAKTAKPKGKPSKAKPAKAKTAKPKKTKPSS